jgi:hypothetical protein
VPTNFGAMLARHGIECRAKPRCGEWLATENCDRAPSFCPNARFFERLKDATQR